MNKKLISIIGVVLLIICSSVVCLGFEMEKPFNFFSNLITESKEEQTLEKIEERTTNINNSEAFRFNFNNIMKANETTTYTVKHYKMKTDGETYAEPEVETKEGIVGTMVLAETKNYEGFSAPKTQSVKIEADGSTEVEYYYTRNKYKLELSANTGISEVTGAGEYYYGQIVPISAKVVKGYSFRNWIDINNKACADAEVKIKILNRDMSFTANAKPDKNIQYTVEHYKMNIDGTTYGDPEIEYKEGKTDEIITPEVRTYKGFTSPETQTVRVNADGSTVVKYYYTRNKYKLELIAGTGIEEVNGSGEYYYEQEVEISAKPLEGFEFDKWVYDIGRTCEIATVKVKIGTRNVMMVAKANPIKQIKYTVKHYRMNIDGTTYAEPEEETKIVESNTEVMPEVKQYEGFTSPAVKTVTVSSDGSTVVEYYYTRNKYKLELKANEGIAEVKGSGEYYYETEVEISAKVKEGYIFDCWKDANGGSSKDINAKVKIGANDAVIEANAKIDKSITYKITYDANGGTAVAEQTVSFGDKIIKPKDPTRNGYKFVGWYVNLTDKEAFDFNKATATQNITLHAKWEANKYTVTFNANGGAGAMADQQFTYDQEGTLNANSFTRGGYTFAGWSETAKGTVQYGNGAKVKNLAESGSKTLYAVWTQIQKYTITYDSKGGTEVAKQEVTAGAKATTPTAPTRKGYTFKNWCSDIDCKTEFNFNTAITGNITLYAKWEANKYTVTFNANGGAGTMADQQFTYDQEATLNTNSFTREGYTFAGWSETAKGTVQYGNGAKVKNLAESGSKTLYAVWTQIQKYTITYDSKGGTEVAKQEVTAGAKATTPTAPTRKGYTFKNWCSDIDCKTEFNFNTAITGNITLYAKWEANKYTVTFNANGGAGTMADQQFTYDQEATLNTNSFTREGYTFAGWSETAKGTVQYGNGAKVKNLAESGSKTLYAVWTQIQKYTITYDSKGGTEVAKQEVTAGAKATTPTAPTRKGYTFKNWCSDIDCKTEFNFNTAITGNITLYAKWEANKYTVTFNANGGAGTMADQQFTYDQEATLNTNSFTREGYTFAGWSETAKGTVQYGNGAKVKNLAESGSKTLYAVWTQIQKYTITYDSKGGTEVAKQEVTAGAKATTPTAPTRKGYTFKNWCSDIDCKTEFNFNTAITGNITLYAKWEANKYTVTFNANGGAGTMADQQFTYDQEKTLSANTFKKDGYTFAGWGETKEDKTAKYTNEQKVKNLAESGSKTLYAVWTQNRKYTIIFNANNGTDTKIEQVIDYDKEVNLNKNTFTEEFTITYKNDKDNQQNNKTEKVSSTFLGWSTEKDGDVKYNDQAKVKAVNMNNGDSINLYAKWQKPTITLQKLNDTEKYKFLGWSTSNEKDKILNANTTYTVVGNITLTAMWEEIKQPDNPPTPVEPKITEISFMIEEANGNKSRGEVCLGDDVFYVKLPDGCSIDISSIQLKTNTPVKLNSEAKATKRTDIAVTDCSEDGRTASLSVMDMDVMKIHSTDGMVWKAEDGEESYISVSMLKLALSIRPNASLGIVKGFGKTDDGKETPRYDSAIKEDHAGNIYIYFYKTGTSTVNIEWHNNGDTIKNTIPTGGLLPERIGVEKEGFDGWYTDANYTTKFDFKKAVTSNTVLYAKYNSNSKKASAVAYAGVKMIGLFNQ